jgi:SAM-dependent methyltransferase
MDYLRGRRAAEAFRPYDLSTPTLQPYRRAARMLAIAPGMRVLVAGSGLGQGAWFLAQLGADVTGVDRAEAVAAATARYAGQSLPRHGRLRYTPADLAAWWPAPEYDAVVVIDVLEGLPRPAAVAWLRRLLHAPRPGAPGLFLHLATTAPLILRLHRLRRRFVPAPAGGPAPMVADGGPHTGAEAAALAREAGGRIARLELRARQTRLRPLERALAGPRPGAVLAGAAAQLVTSFDAVLVPELDAVLRRAGGFPPTSGTDQKK